MKRYFLILILLFGVASLHAQSQFSSYVGDITVTRQELSVRNGKLHLVLDIRVAGNAVTRSQSWTIIPELSVPGKRSETCAIFPYIQINGKYQAHMQERRLKLKGGRYEERAPWMTIVVDRKTDKQATYEMTVPYEPWMDEATLVLRHILTNPGRKARVFTVDVNGAVDIENSTIQK